MVNFAIQTVINGLALWIAAWAVPGITFGDDMGTANTVLTVGIVALIFGLVNALVRPIAALLSLPFIILTLGLFIFILNAAMLQLTSWLAGVFDLAFHVDEVLLGRHLGCAHHHLRLPPPRLPQDRRLSPLPDSGMP